MNKCRSDARFHSIDVKKFPGQVGRRRTQWAFLGGMCWIPLEQEGFDIVKEKDSLRLERTSHVKGTLILDILFIQPVSGVSMGKV
jgi:hypothetical protein